jgi:hypothetical protein
MLEGNYSQRSEHHYWKTLEGKSSHSKRKIPHKIRERKNYEKKTQKSIYLPLSSRLFSFLLLVYMIVFNQLISYDTNFIHIRKIFIINKNIIYL